MWNTWGTHLGDTKLVASIDKRPVFDSMSINLIFVCVGTIACKDTNYDMVEYSILACSRLH